MDLKGGPQSGPPFYLHGETVGNGLEIKECIPALRGKMSDDLKEVVLMLGSWMIYAADCVTEEVAISRLSEHALIKYKAELMYFIEKGNAYKGSRGSFSFRDSDRRDSSR